MPSVRANRARYSLVAFGEKTLRIPIAFFKFKYEMGEAFDSDFFG